eukprot:CAMPEP_0194069708 /NCGR_PEP_ID=MMETSP0009_2-20130614/87788_1 /TAXON_ID=210454 /ORGANISM="Grammatophora oceanica, Strain CCMP 410" /LENGTH=528 /DNA_ID=CAMNT_0038722923 /DNA_START=9 /DNA_END=1595 /DNA_ORIENTATION=-
MARKLQQRNPPIADDRKPKQKGKQGEKKMKKAVRLATYLAATSSVTSTALDPPKTRTSACGLRAAATPIASLITSAIPRGGGPKANEQDDQKPPSRRKKKKTKSKKKKTHHSKISRENAPVHHEQAQAPGDTQAADDIADDAKSTSAANPRREKGDPEPKATSLERPDPLLEEIVKEEDLHKILGVPKTASEREILKAYRRRCVKTHPDKTGDRRAFDKVSEAYDILSDPDKRKLYDRFGKAGLDGPQLGSSPFGRPEDLFRSFFGQSSDPFSSRPSPINRTVRYQLEVSLEELYQGLTKRIVVDNHGSRKEVEVHGPRGTTEGEGIVLSGEMDFVEGQPPADLMFLISERRHPVFTRRNHDLAMEMEISLREALCGIDTRTIKTLDGRMIAVSTAKLNSPIRTGDVYVLRSEGMPKRDQEGEHGDLYIQLQVAMPSSTGRLSDDEKHQLSILLGKMEGLDDPRKSSSEQPREISKSSVSNFGRASGSIPRSAQFQNNQEDSFSSSRSFFYSSAGARQGQDNVQCKQM